MRSWAWATCRAPTRLGDKLPLLDFLRAAHNTLRAHGRAVVAVRAAAPSDASIGTPWPWGQPSRPAIDSEDLAAARAAQRRVAARRLVEPDLRLDPILRGGYPEDGLALFGADSPGSRAATSRRSGRTSTSSA